jgi:uncharacterized glyoxalase superfamily protein PhnB
MSPRTRRRFAPEGWPILTPRLFAHDPERLVGFIKRVFTASGDIHGDRPAELRIGDSVILVSDASARRPAGAFLYVCVEDADATYQRALASGARPIEPPSDMPYGDRRAMVEDDWGNTWQIATHRARRATAASRRAGPCAKSGRRTKAGPRTKS